MERKIGETFEFEGKKLKVNKSASSGCDGCFFEGRCSSLRKEVTGHCQFEYRTDNNEVIFVEVQEQSQELNLCEILKYCPDGESFWSPLFGDVKFNDINNERNFINIILEDGETWNINTDGTISLGTTTSPEIMLYPSREQIDWTKVKYEKKKERFDPKTLKPFDRVLVKRGGKEDKWTCNIFSFYSEGTGYDFECLDDVYENCIPYNEETKHLVGTSDEAPEFYRYWED